MGVREGYKLTELGLVPIEWANRSIRELSELVTVGFVGPMAHLFVRSGVPLLRGQNVLPNKIDFSDSKFISRNTHKSWSKSALRVGDIVIVRVGYPGTCAVVPVDFGEANAASLIIVRPNLGLIAPDFLCWVLLSDVGRKQISESLVGGAQQVINIATAASLRAPVPPLDEQCAIAEALSDVDALLSGLDRLVAKKRDLKQATMQQLLTGQTRLPGFHGEWEKTRLKQVAEISAGINKPLGEMGSGTLYVTVQDLYDGTSIRTERLSRIRVSPSEMEGRSLSVGDIVFGKSSVKREGIGYPSRFVGAIEPVVFSGFTYRARARTRVADALFLFYGLRAEKSRRWVIDNAQASALTNINQAIADAIPVMLPPSVDEQAAIAQVLSDMDAELAALEARREKTRQLKQGMMQELLTGRTRLV